MMAGVTVVAWYPITPSSSLCESLIGYMKKYRIDKETGKATFAIVQAEDEIASLGMVIGASWAGARSMTATAGPGISLMSEFAGLAYYAETPAVIFDVQRVGPSTGLPTRTAQGDLLSGRVPLARRHQAHHADPVLGGGVLRRWRMEAFDLAEQFQTPVFVMMDLDLGMNNWMSDGVQVSGQADQPRQAADRREAQASSASGAATRTWTATAFRTARFRATACRRISRAAPATTRRGSTASGPTTTSRTWTGSRASSRRRASSCRSRWSTAMPKAKIGFIALRHVALGDRARAATSCARRPSVETSYFRLRAYPFTDGARGVHRRARARLRHRAEPRRAAAAADEAGAARRSGRRKLRSVLHYNGLPIDARSITDDVLAQEGFEVAKKTASRMSAGHRRGGGIDRMSDSHDSKVNRIGLEPQIYKGGKTTLCAGCGHNAISERIIDAFYEMGVDPSQVVKLSGIGCSSKSPAYFLGGSHGFNAVHGRMPSVGTGAMLANQKLIAIGISGDGDTGAIGIGQFVHLMRRNLPIIYIIEDNGCYGLTKGQFSPTADLGSKLKTGVVNDLPPIDTCALAIELGATFVGALVLGRQEAAARRCSRRRWRTAAR